MPGDMKTRRYIGAVVSGVLILVLLLVFTDPWSTLRKDGKRMILHQPETVDRIVLADSYDSTLLEKGDSGWLLFGSEEINPVAVENLLFAAERIQINSIVAEQAGLEESGRKIRFYSGSRLLLSYQLFNDNGSHLLKPEGSTRTYYVSVSGYPDLDLGKIFSAASNHYRQHLLIDLLPSEISMIGIELGNGQAFRFIQDTLGNISCIPANVNTTLPGSEPDDLAVRLLFSYFTAIRYEHASPIGRGEVPGLTADQGMLARLQVESFKGEKHLLTVYPYVPDPDGDNDLFRALVLYNENPEALVVNYIYLDVLMRDLSHYF
jgi:hypothetical protein